MARPYIPVYSVHEPRIVDSDTLEAWIQVHHDVRLRWRIRLRGIEGGEADTPTGARGHLSLQHTLQHWYSLGMVLQDDGHELDKHGRHVTDILCADLEPVTSKLLRAGTHWPRKRSTRAPEGETTHVQPSPGGSSDTNA